MKQLEQRVTRLPLGSREPDPLDELDSILERQIPDEEKRPRADFAVDSGADLSTTESQVRDILACLGLGGGE